MVASFEKTEESFAGSAGKTVRCVVARAFCRCSEDPLPRARHPLPRSSTCVVEGAGGSLLLEGSALSTLECVPKEFEHPVIQAGLLFNGRGSGSPV